MKEKDKKDSNKKSNKNKPPTLLGIGGGAAIGLAAFFIFFGGDKTTEISYNEFIQKVENKEIEKIRVNLRGGSQIEV